MWRHWQPPAWQCSACATPPLEGRHLPKSFVSEVSPYCSGLSTCQSLRTADLPFLCRTAHVSARCDPKSVSRPRVSVDFELSLCCPLALFGAICSGRPVFFWPNVTQMRFEGVWPFGPRSINHCKGSQFWPLVTWRHQNPFENRPEV